MKIACRALGRLLALLCACVAAEARAAETVVTILTATTGGIWYPLGGALSSIYSKAIKGVSFTVQATQGSVEDLRLLKSGDGELAFTLAGVPRRMPGPAIRMPASAHRSSGCRASRGSIRTTFTFTQAKKYDPGLSRISRASASGCGAEQSGSALNAAAVLKAAGLTFDDLAKVDHASLVNSARMVEQGALDAAFSTVGLGTEYVRHLLYSAKVTFVPIPPEVVAKIGNPAYVAGTIPAGTYDGQPAEVPTAAVMTLLVTREAVSDDLVYLMTKSLFDHSDLLVQTNPVAKDIGVAKALSGLPIPLHPGAQRYYREIGLVK